MSDSSRRRTFVIVAIIFLLLLALLLARCPRSVVKAVVEAPAASSPAQPSKPTEVVPDSVVLNEPEKLTPATLQVPSRVSAGAVFRVAWTGPNNKRDYVTIVAKEAASGVYTNYRDTRDGGDLELTAPIQPGEYEVRYMTAVSKNILGRVPIIITPNDATLNAPAEVILGAPVSVEWTGPDNKDDYVTLVSINTPDGKYDNFTYTVKGSPLILTAPAFTGDAELRYMTGQGAKVLARRPVRIVAPEIKLSAPTTCIAGSTIAVTWSGPNNAGDYITLVSRETRDGLYGNYSNTSAGSPLKILVPIFAGDAELRYMSGQGAKVLGRESIKILAPEIMLSAVSEVASGAAILVKWSGPNNPGDYITVVPKTASDGQYGSYENTTKGSPLTVTAPKDSGEAELRYMSGQGAKVLARQLIRVIDSK